MSRFTEYPSYVTSDAPWLHRMPSAWRTVPLGHLATFENGRAFKPEEWAEGGTPIIRIENLNGSLNFNRYAGHVDERHQVRRGDLLFGWSGNRGTSFGPYIWSRDGDYHLNQHIFKVSTQECSVTWLYWCLKAVTAYIEGQTNGIIGMVHVTKSELRGIKVAVPSSAEQVQINRFLDRETIRIDALIEKKTRFIELLREKRQALITQAITQGLDSSAPMKDSGAAWLGRVPAHWEVRQLKHVCVLIKDGTHLPPPRVADGIALLSVRNLIDGEFKRLPDDSLISESAYAELCRSFVPKGGDVLLAIVGATLGKSAVLEDDFGQFHLQRSVAAFRPNANLVSSWLRLVFESQGFQSLLWEHAGYSAQPGIYLGTLAAFKVPLPPVEEQWAVLSRLRPKLAHLHRLEALTASSTALMAERRSALITAAVTGQIDLREAA